MIIGVPREVKDHETRVGLVPSGVSALIEAGHQVLVQARAGAGSTISDSEYIAAGAQIINTPAEVWNRADLVVKVKEPQPS
jgi:alanine dehydrogenase